MKKVITGMLFVAALASYAQTASKVCGTDEKHQLKMQQDPSYASSIDQFNQFLQQQSGTSHNKMAPILRVPVVVHVMHHGEPIGTGYNISDSDIKTGIRLANERFRKIAGGVGDGAGVDVEIEFALAVRDMGGNCTDGIVRVDMSGNPTYVNGGVGSGGINESTLKATSRWTDEDYYNIYIVSEIDNANCFTGGGYTAGYAYLAGAHGQSYDGIVILSCTFANSTTLTHELGHALNLYHTFEGGSCSEANCNTDGDLCCDTPPIAGSNSNCSTPECSGTQQVENYMDYTSDACQDMFTADQTNRMRTALTGVRASFLESNGNMSLVPPAAPTADFFSGASVVCNGSTVNYYDDSNCTPNTYTNSPWSGISFSWTFDDGVNTPITSTDQNPSITFATNGIYDVTLEVTNANGTNSITKQDFIVVSNGPVAGSCSPGIQNVGYFGYAISNVNFNTISNSTGSVDNGNQDYTCTNSTVVYRDSTYDLSIDVEALGSQTGYYAVYIDYDNDGILGEAGETVQSGSLASGTGPTTISTPVTIPSTAIQNNSLRMRVINDQFDLSGPCDNLFTGESEDYTVFVGTPSVGLAIKDFTFDAIKEENKKVQLSWSAKDERGFESYQLERSTDHKNWRPIKNIVVVNGEKNGSYYETDKVPDYGHYFYRLVIKHKTGTIEYSSIREVVFDDYQLSLFPNPASDQLTISGLENEADLIIYDLTGKTIMSTSINDPNRASLNLTDIAEGTYIIQIRTENHTFVDRLIKSTK